MEPTEEQYLIVNALETLELLISSRYDRETGHWYILTTSSALPISMILPNGEIVPTSWES